MRNCFCGWYFRCQSEQQTLAVIPSVHRTKEFQFCSIQLITDTQSFQVPFPYSCIAVWLTMIGSALRRRVLNYAVMRNKQDIPSSAQPTNTAAV